MDSVLINEVTKPHKCVILAIKGTNSRIKDNITNLVTRLLGTSFLSFVLIIIIYCRFILHKDDEGEYEQIDLSEFKNEDYLLENGTISSDFIRPIGPGILVLIDTASKQWVVFCKILYIINCWFKK